MKIDEKKKTQIKYLVICIVIVLAIWFIMLNPILKFKNNEKIVEDAAIKYYEINNKLLPTGEKIKTVQLQTLYDKDFINKDLRTSYVGKVCNVKNSWVKVKRQDTDYKYYVYLDCGLFKSKVDHEGPKITLNGKDEITVYKGDEYKDPGIKSVVDNTDGKIDVKKVSIDSKKLNTDRIGTYTITYKIKDSFENETIKVRTIHVTQTLNHIVEKDTNNVKIYKGSQDANYVKLDGIIFKIVGENEDNTIKIVSSENISAINYEDIDTWLNDYFYNKLSDSAKKLIEKSKWCDEKVADPNNYTSCNHYSKKKNIGILSIADINNSKSSEGDYNISFSGDFWLGNSKDDSNQWTITSRTYKEQSINNNIIVRPTINLVKDIKIVEGSGNLNDPYILQGNKKILKPGEKISEAKAGEYIIYSGYKWRVIGKENDETTLIIMNNITNDHDSNYYARFDENSSLQYNPDKKNNIGYYVTNNITNYIKTGMFEKKKVEIKNYNNSIKYSAKSKNSGYNVKMVIPSMYDLFSTDFAEQYWYRDYSSSKKTNCYLEYTKIVCDDYKYDLINGVRIEGYLKKAIEVKSGQGTIDDAYTIAN